MSGCVEIGICDICKKEAHLQRTYFRYNIKCECHSPYHFELCVIVLIVFQKNQGKLKLH